MMHQALMGFRQDADAVRGKRVDRAVLRRVLGFTRPYRRAIAGFVIMVVLASVVGAIPPLLFRELLDKAIPKKDLGLVTTLSLAAVVLAVANAGLSLLQRWYSSAIGEGLIYDLRVALYDHIQRLPISFFTRTQTGALMSRLNNDVVGAQQAVTGTLGTAASNFVGLSVTLAVMLRLEWRLTILTISVLPAFIIPAKRIGKRLQKVTREAMILNASMNTTVAERFNVAGALLVKLFGRHDDERDDFGKRARRVADIGVVSAMYARVLFVALSLVGAIGTACVYWVGGRLAIDGAMSVGTVAAFVIYVGQVYSPLAQLTTARVDIMTAFVSFERVFEVLDFEPSIAERPGAFDLGTGDVAAQSTVAANGTVTAQSSVAANGTAAADLGPLGSVEFEGVWFRHPPASQVSIPSLEERGTETKSEEASDWILRNISFKVRPGEMVALVGPSGAGKTTIGMLVPRMYDANEGRVTIDGHDVRDLTLSSLRGAIGVVAQDPHLFHASIAENLRYARPDTTDEQLVEACKAARIHDLIAALPDGYDTVVGERGYRVSGGEKQRIAIARLLLKDPKIVILDEATSHLDSESEAAIQLALATALQGRTAIVIAHRLSTIVNADRILAINHGEIVEEGSHGALMAKGGLYADLYRTQLTGTSEIPLLSPSLKT